MPVEPKRDALPADQAPLRARPSIYPPPYRTVVERRHKQPLGDLFGLGTFGVNLTRLEPGAWSALHHSHERQDEFIFVIEGEPTLIVADRETALRPGMVAGFPAGGEPHHLENRTERDCLILEVGDRSPGDRVSYPDADLMAVAGPDGRWIPAHKDGTPY